jgi:two-component system, chemotaxis family, CheB/CheR fusion protein
MTEATEVDEDFESLLAFVRDSRGFDFTGYKRSTLMRRVRRRMDLLGVETFTDYLDHLQVHPDEFSDLFDFILINVTSFFRDDAVWSYVAAEVIPRIVRSKEPAAPIRVWDAGCASGEETYTIAMLLADELGRDAFVDRVKIYGTDVDAGALEQARHGDYTTKQLEPVPSELVDRYFRAEPDDRRSFDRDLRRAVVFGRHDLVQDAPISRVDLLVCRNTLMYFNADAQAKILANFRFALAPNGFMILGKAEMLFGRARAFAPVDMKRRVFVGVEGDERLPGMMRPLDPTDADDSAQREAAFEAFPIAQIVVTVDGRLMQVNALARMLLPLDLADLGHPLQDLEVSYRPVELRSLIEAAHEQRRTQVVSNIDWLAPGGVPVRLDVQVVPFFARDGSSLGTTITFTDVTRSTRLEAELQTSHQELETAMEELQSTNEELETTNEELQSTNEELETTNEELQSTNEELETMNEELRSTNEELENVNEEARQRSDELDHVNLFLGSVLASLRAGLIVVDPELRVDAWNERSEDLWGLREEEVVGQTLGSLDLGLPVAELMKPIRSTLEGTPQVVEIEAMTRRGRDIRCRVSSWPLARDEGSVVGAVLLVEEL